MVCIVHHFVLIHILFVYKGFEPDSEITKVSQDFAQEVSLRF